MGYAPVLIDAFGMADDFDVLCLYWEQGSQHSPFLGSMRPLGGVLADVSYWLTGPEFHNFWILRLIHLLFLGLFCTLFARTLESLDIPRPQASLLALIMGLSPAVQVVVSFSMVSFLPLAGICGIFAFRLARRALDNRAWRIPCLLLAWLCLIAGLSMYQIYPMIFWAFVLAETLQRRADLSAHFLRLVKYGLIFAAGLVLYYGLCGMILPDLLGHPIAERTAFTHNPFYNIAYFIIRPLRDTLNLFMLSYYGPLASAESYWDFIPSYLSALAIGTFILFGLYRRYKEKTWPARIVMGGFIFGILLLSYLPNLLIDFLFTPYRTQYALFACVLFLLFAAIRTLAPRYQVQCLLVLAVLSLGFCLHHIQRLVVDLHRSEWNLVLSGVEEAVQAGTKDIVVIMPDQALIKTKTTYYGEFGTMVSMTDRGEHMVKVALRELGEDYSNYDISSGRFGAGEPVANSGFKIDMRPLY